MTQRSPAVFTLYLFLAVFPRLQLHTQDLAPLDDCFCIDTVIVEGNKVTKESIILRELTFPVKGRTSGTLLEVEVARTHKNLMNSRLFNFVSFSYDTLSDAGPSCPCLQALRITITVTERWYIWPNPLLHYEERNFSIWLAERDISRVSYGLSLVHSNFRGRKENLTFTFQHGYNRQLWFEYLLPYINGEKTLGLYFAGGTQKMHEVPFATIDGKRKYIKDPHRYLYNRNFVIGALRLRRAIHIFHELNFGVEDIQWGDTILELNPGFSATSNGMERYLWMHYKIKFDYRDNASYPLDGWYADFEILKDGFGLFPESGPDYNSVRSIFRKYNPLGRGVYASLGLFTKLGSSGKPPHYLNKGLGYGRYIARGYEYYVIDGQAFAMLKSNLKFTLLAPRSFRIPIPMTEQFTRIHLGAYVNLYGDVARVRDVAPAQGNVLANTLLYSGGMGIDFVTYYDKVLRFDLSVNHLGEAGLYIHFIAPV